MEAPQVPLMSGRYRQWGRLGHYQILVCLIVASILASAYAHRAEKTAAHSEMVSMRLFERSMANRLSEMRLRGRGMLELIGANPVGLVVPELTGYVGEYSDANAQQIDAGSWFFDPRKRVLVYRVMNARWFESDLADPVRIHYQLVPHYADTNANARFDPGIDPLYEVRLQAQNTYRWNLNTD